MKYKVRLRHRGKEANSSSTGPRTVSIVVNLPDEMSIDQVRREAEELKPAGYELIGVEPDKRPFYEIILTKMETRVPLVLGSQQAEYELQEFGEVLALSVLPEDKIRKIIFQLQKFVLKLSPEGNEAAARKFIEELIEKISAEEK